MAPYRSFVFGTCLWGLTIVAVGALSAQTADPRIGTWHLNVAKSQFDPGPVPKSIVLKIEPADDGEKVINEITDQHDSTLVMQYTAYFDGRDYYLTGSPLFDSVALKRIDARTTERIDRKRGEVVQILTRVVSEDGRTMTIKMRGRDALDRNVNNMLLFEKR